ncbi:Mono- and diacylglycerol lipase (MDGL) [Durusdinium trenchii]|uniref:Mono- and diacylglycerol lipase (MDGL) n=1 Tax=Durusdinium trenchii TaxID=1381693 RepID=A0ABP0PIL6_9DINO
MALLALLLLAAGGVSSEATTSFDWPYEEDVARAFASLTSASYCGADEGLMNWTCRECEDVDLRLNLSTLRFVERRELIQPNSTFVLLARVSTRTTSGCVLSFRGSTTVTNWIEDFRFWNTPVPFSWCKGCYVEAGFSSIWHSVKDEVQLKLGQMGCVPVNQRASVSSTSNLYITGHSLGAAVGTIAMCSLEASGYNVGLSYLFESPRVGNTPFTEAFDHEFARRIPMYRITHSRDPVPHLPPRYLTGFRYAHVNYEVFYDENGVWHFCTQEEDRNCSDRYSLPQTLRYTSDHCASPLAASGSLCHCPLHRHSSTILV